MKCNRHKSLFRRFYPSHTKMFRSVPRRCGKIRLSWLVCSLFLIFNFGRLSLNDLKRKKSPLAGFSMIEKIQFERKSLIEEECRKIKFESRKKPDLVRFYIDHRHALMYCDVPKVASTNLKRMMLILSGIRTTQNLSSIPLITVHDNNPMPQLDALDLTDIYQIGLANYTKFIFVRHPLERLVSAYQDKFAGDNKFFHEAIGKEIIKKYRKKPTPLSLKNGHDVTFPEFVSYVIDEWKIGERHLDVHWRPIIDLCHPCTMKYDFIGKFETLNQDVDFFLHTLNESKISEIFGLSRPPTKAIKSSWKNVIKMINHQQLSDLKNIFVDDFRLFRYM